MDQYNDVYTLLKHCWTYLNSIYMILESRKSYFCYMYYIVKVCSLCGCRTVQEFWHVLAGDEATLQNVLDRLLESLIRSVPYQEKPDPHERDKTKTIRIANHQPIAVSI